mmetsp:Transcript_18246/g.44799  ORF Transcript_18246/g.44799 Transcript_18246/m.44799 type:complete len:225 (-) Transcript_18246:316-990(-)|eukprot:CAMPEP_0114506228 /NCGR_PEP_ID=MMETSP0109-20121206/11309_1 /TAXON_ID=29199 /ORGANISM="Chlorarachnion reptans, Strain CCCM449" /LENGTH=224 /DNA_ID=CAMNT_0001684789 /DNA_START=83 /DNA_END=757 /DNA_ORIENTATION=+
MDTKGEKNQSGQSPGAAMLSVQVEAKEEKDSVLELFDSVSVWHLPDVMIGGTKGASPETFDIREYLGGKMAVVFFFQSWCKGCHEFAEQSLKPLVEEFRSEPRVRFVAVQTVFEGFKENTAEKAKNFQIEHKLKFPVGHDGPLDTSTLPEEIRTMLRNQLAHEDELPSSIMVKVGSQGTPWTLILAPNQLKGGKMEVLHSGFRFDWKKARDMLKQQLAASEDRK